MNFKRCIWSLGLLLVLLLPDGLKGQQQTTGVFTDDSLMVMTRYNQGRGRLHYNQGVGSMQQSNFLAAVQQFSEALTYDPMLAEAYFNRGIAHSRLKNDVEALLDIASAIQLDPRPEFYYGRALIAVRRNDLNSALSDMQRASQTDPPHPDLLLSIGVLQFRLRNYPAALDAFTRLNRNDKQNITALNGLAMVYLHLGDTASARDKLAESIEVDTSQTEVLLLLGDLSMKAGRLSEACNFFAQAIALDEKNYKALNALAVVYVLSNNRDSAFYYCKTAINANPGYPPSWNTSGNVFYLSKDYQKAEADYSMAISLAPDLWKAYYNRALSREMQRNDQGACDDWKKAGDNGVKEAKEQILQNCE